MSSKKPTCIWYSKTGISSFPGGPNCLLTAEYLKITTNKTYNVHLPNMLIFVCTVTLHLCKRKFFWLHNIEIIWFFKDLHTSVHYIIQIKSIPFRFHIQNPHTRNQYYNQDIFFEISCSTKNLVPNLLNLWQIWQHLLQCKLFFKLNYGASKQVL